MIKFLSLHLLECSFFSVGTIFGTWLAFVYCIYMVIVPLILAGGLIVWNVRRECSYMDAGFKEIDDE